MSFKKYISSAAALILAVNLMAVSAAAVGSEDREAIKSALFEYMWNSEGWSNWDDDENYTAIEDNPSAAYWYSLIAEFVEQCDESNLKDIDTDWHSSRDIKEFFGEFADWYYTSKYNDWDNEYEDGEYIIKTEDGEDGAPYLYFQDSGDHWELVNENGIVIDNYDKLYQFSYLNEEPEEDENDDIGELNSTVPASGKSDSAERAAAGRVTGIPTDKPVTAETAEITGRTIKVEFDDDEDEDSGISALPIIGSLVGGMAVGAAIVAVITKANGKKKK